MTGGESIKETRVAILSIHSCPKGELGTRDTGGMSVYIREIAAKLALLGYRVDIFTRKHSPGDREVMDLAPGVRLIHLKAGPEKGDIDKISLYFHLDEFVEELEGFRRTSGAAYDLIFSHYWLSGICGGILASRWGVGHAVMFHTLSAVKNRLDVGEKEPQLRQAGEREVAQNSDLIIVATENEKNDVVGLYKALPERIEVIPPGVDLDLFKPEIGAGPATGSRRITYVGRIDPLKGLDRLLMVLREIDNGQTSCDIIGGGDSSQEEILRLKGKIEDYRLRNVSFIGLVEQENLPAHYNRASVLALPSYYESYGLVALEALACGCPVVCTGVGDLPSIIKQGVSGHVVEPYSLDGFSSALSYWLENPATTMEQKLKIRATVKRFGWGRTAQKLDLEFKKLINSTCRVS